MLSQAKTGEQIPSLRYVKEGYTAPELETMILQGQAEIPALDRAKPKPPLYMPAWRGKIGAGEMSDLVAYLQSLFPEEEEMEW